MYLFRIFTLFLLFKTSFTLSSFFTSSVSNNFSRESAKVFIEIICRTEKKLINVYYMKKYQNSALVPYLLGKVHKCFSASVQTYYYEQALMRTDLNETPPSLMVLIIPNEDSENIDYCLEAVRKYRTGKRYIKYLIIFERINSVNLEPARTWLKKTFDIMWEKAALNVIAVFNEGEEIKIYTYNPFDNQMPFIPIKNWVGVDIFDSNTSINMHKQELTVSVTPNNNTLIRTENPRKFEGIDGRFASLLEKKLNATFVYVTEPDGEILLNETATGAIASVIEGRVNISINSRVLNAHYYAGKVEFTKAFQSENLCVLVPKAEQLPQFYNLFYTMEIPTWIAAILVTFFATFAYKVVQDKNKNLKSLEDDLQLNWIETFFMILQSFFGDSLTRLPNSSPPRLVVITWIMYSVIISSAFTATLVSKLTFPQYENEIDTLEELHESGLEIIVRQMYVHSMRPAWDQQLFKKLKHQFHPMYARDYYDHLYRNSTTVAYAMKEIQADYELARMYNKVTGRPLFYKMQQNLVPSCRGYIVTLGSPFLGDISDLYLRFEESGFFVHWKEMADFHARIKGFILDDEEIEEQEEEEDEDEAHKEKVQLGIEHMQSAFMLLGFGLMLSFMIFVGEIIFTIYLNTKMNKVRYFEERIKPRIGYRDGF